MIPTSAASDPACVPQVHDMSGRLLQPPKLPPHSDLTALQPSGRKKGSTERGHQVRVPAAHACQPNPSAAMFPKSHRLDSCQARRAKPKTNRLPATEAPPGGNGSCPWQWIRQRASCIERNIRRDHLSEYNSSTPCPTPARPNSADLRFTLGLLRQTTAPSTIEKGSLSHPKLMKNRKRTRPHPSSPDISSLVTGTIAELRELSQRVDKALNDTKLARRTRGDAWLGTVQVTRQWARTLIELGRSLRTRKSNSPGSTKGERPWATLPLDRIARLLQHLQKNVRQLSASRPRQRRTSRGHSREEN